MRAVQRETVSGGDGHAGPSRGRRGCPCKRCLCPLCGRATSGRRRGPDGVSLHGPAACGSTVRRASQQNLRLQDCVEKARLQSDRCLDHASRGESHDRLQQALEKLPPEQREVVSYRLAGELTFAQIGQALEISTQTAASRYRYAVNLRLTRPFGWIDLGVTGLPR